MKRTIVLWRDCGLEYENEKNVMEEYFHCISSRVEAKQNEVVIARYSALPFYDELEKDLQLRGAQLINSYAQHRYIADLWNWYQDLEGLTPRTWNNLQEVPEEEAPFVVKGATNSRKHQWDTHMFAPTKRAAVEIWCELQNDGLIGTQPLYVRKYMPFHCYLRGIHDLPITEEYRFFVAYGEILCGAFYWSSHVYDLIDRGIRPHPSIVPAEFLQTVIKRIGNKAAFYAIDVGHLEDGSWMVVELNDGQMSGLSENKPEELYQNLSVVLGQQ
jgi:hypothetical protein